MISIQHLYHSMEDFAESIATVEVEKECLVQIFTTVLEPEACVALAQEVKAQLPFAQIIGSSVNGVIYRGKQFDQHTMMTIEQYKNSKIGTHLFSIEGKDANDVANNLEAVWSDGAPKLLRLFLGAYYGEAHQLIDQINERMSGMQVVGGMSGELYGAEVLPFVFNDKEYIHGGLICAGVSGGISTYNRINTARERISEPYTITKAEGRIIYEIEGESAQNWLQRNLGFKSNQEYDTWEEIANNDPLVRFHIALEDYKKATRFVHFDREAQEISQYFTQLESGTKFRISYTSPAKCVEECKKACKEIMETPIEQLFCYSCVFRKLYLKNCAKWEISPYHKNPISGVFLLGEFGHYHGKNELLNGSCVLSGICEEEHYLQVDLTRLDQLEGIQVENEGLLDFLLNNQTQAKSIEQEQLLTDAMAYERTHQPDFYRYIDSSLNIGNMLQYSLDKVKYGFDKLCLVKVENADILISFMGQAEYMAQLKEMIARLDAIRLREHEDIFVYSGNADSFVIAATAQWTKQEFLELIHRLDRRCDEVQNEFVHTPIILRFVVVSGGESLLEQAYGQAEMSKNTQTRIMVLDAKTQDKSAIKKELECIHLIQNTIAEKKVIPYYQGIYNNRLGKIDKYEALMRIRDQEGNVLTPYFFMDTAKKYRLYLDLNLLMLEAVLDDFSTIDCAVNINLCAHDIASPKFREVLRKRLKTFHKPENITFELLEDECFSDMEVLKDFIAEVRAYGVKISIDDFGSGYSNLLEIVKIQPDYLKIDGEIVRDAHEKPENEIIIGVIVSLAHQLSIDVVAEFVENEAIQNVVESYGILRSQGYLFSKPQPFAQIYPIEKQVCDHTEDKGASEDA